MFDFKLARINSVLVHSMKTKFNNVFKTLPVFILILLSSEVSSKDYDRHFTGNFGLPGIIDLPSGQRLPDGELIVTQQLHGSLARASLSFQALPRLGFSFRYSGHGVGGGEAYGRVNHDRSFDAHLSIIDEQTYMPALSIGLRDFIGTGWYSSEYIVSTKSIKNLELTVGLGFGRLAGRDSFSNPIGGIYSGFYQRDGISFGRGGSIKTINWFQGDASIFYGVTYRLGRRFTLSAEYSTDDMAKESSYLNIKSPWNIGGSYHLNKYLNISAQYLHGSEISLAAQIYVNPRRPPLPGGKDLAPVPMRLRGEGAQKLKKTDTIVIGKVLQADLFELHKLSVKDDTVKIALTNTKFRSTAQAVGRIASTLQRFTSDEVKRAKISFYRDGLQIANYLVDLEKIGEEQFHPRELYAASPSIKAIDADVFKGVKNKKAFTWGIGPYITHRLFNPDLPLSAETGIELASGYEFVKGLKISGSIRKSVLTNLTDNKRRSNSVLPRVHSDWPLYDFAGQSGHIHTLKLSYFKNLAPGLYGRAHAGLLEPFFAGIGGEILYKPAQSPLGIGLDIHRVRKRDYDMRFQLRDYQTNLGHISLYYDAGGLFELEINAGRYLAGDWGVTTTLSRKFGSGWEVGGYATFTDVPFATFGEGSFDKAIYVSIPIDWIISSPTKTKRRLTLRPITRDGGANLASARKLNYRIKTSQNSNFQREIGRLWK